jgi:ABC-type multidrug transport system fused ATPase/permease subunit
MMSSIVLPMVPNNKIVRITFYPLILPSGTMREIIKVAGLGKSYGDILAVDDISFSVGENQLFAFLGPNGAGKSTTINMICTLLAHDKGEIVVDGHRIGEEDAEIRRILGIVFQNGVLDPLLTVRENIRTRAPSTDSEGKNSREGSCGHRPPQAPESFWTALTASSPGGRGDARTSPAPWSAGPGS